MEPETEMRDAAADLVTETDQAVEKFVLGRIKEKYPDYEYDSLSRFIHGLPLLFGRI